MKKRFYIMGIIILLPFESMAGWFGPSNYEECVLDKLSGVESRGAAIQLKRACEVKYDKKYIQPFDVFTKVEYDEWANKPRYPARRAADCKLSHITKTTDRIAANIISAACNDLYPTGKKLMTAKEVAHLRAILSIIKVEQ